MALGCASGGLSIRPPDRELLGTRDVVELTAKNEADLLTEAMNAEMATSPRLRLVESDPAAIQVAVEVEHIELAANPLLQGRAEVIATAWVVVSVSVDGRPMAEGVRYVGRYSDYARQTAAGVASTPFPVSAADLHNTGFSKRLRSEAVRAALARFLEDLAAQ